ncbi:AAA family ATPase [Streptomyces sp. NBC_01728]|uniref:MobF family relaxase n=1 Tax=unclassified Streptomyces TaxID=2593676 RepID=UPI002250D740|nr:MULTISPECIES: MobF family relaxase [unclassified Streptomyces]MCX4462432.1 AAA family ATPase [Streptomyces sp. NBC_01719]MCX4500862.1 AAA family ATPase [Streptomyces sp. NBC_01728]
MLSISAGSDPAYLTREVAAGAEHYYARSVDLQGEPPGYWLGDGAAELGLEGTVDNEVFTDLYKDWIDPRKRDEMYERLAAIPHEEGTPEYAKAEKAIRKDARLGNAPKNYEKSFQKRFAAAIADAQAKTPGVELTPERVKAIELDTRKHSPSATLYYDLTFSAPKSWSVYHASLQVKAMQCREAGDLEGAERYAAKADRVWDAWKVGVKAGLEHMQEEAGYTRLGHHGAKIEGRSTGRYVKGEGFIVSAWAQHTSRDDDPQLHVHATVLNKIKAVEIDPVTGEERVTWASVDGHALWVHKQAVGHLAERIAEQELERTEGVRVMTRPDGKAREIVGIDQDLRDGFSSRRVAIKAEVAEVAQAYEERYGTAPSPYVLARMSEDVTLQQRQAKKHDAVTRDQLLDRWEAFSQERFRDSLANVPDQVEHESLLHDLHRPYKEFDPERIQRRAIAAVQEQKATWRRPDLIVELNRQLPDTLGGMEAHEVRDLLNRLADEALDPATDNGVVCATAPHMVEIPVELQRPDGSFVYEPADNNVNRFATERHIATEERMRTFAGERGGPTVPSELVEAVIARRGLKGKQADFVRSAATSGRKLDLLIGPAGAGKSYTLAALTEVWEAHDGRQVIGLASGERAAQVLADEGLTNVANISMLLKKHADMAAGKNVPDADKYRIAPGSLVIVDEAGMTNTPDMDRVRALVESCGAKMIGSGDHHQLTAVGAGGMFGQLAEEMPGVHTLEEVRRFRDIDPVTGESKVREWEAKVSLQLREGDTEALAQYELHGRFRGGSAEEMKERAYQGWVTDQLAGRNPLLVAPDNETAAELSARARADLVRAGLVEEDGVALRTGQKYGVETKAGRGDVIQMRRNNRNIEGEGGQFATNRLTATVTGISDNGSLMVQLEDGSRMHLPAAYVQTHVELGYASTVHGAQGRTVGPCHSLVDEQTTREALYVSLTRGQDGNWAYVITHRDGDGIKAEDVPHYLATLDQTLQRSGTQQTATQAIAAELERREHLAALEPVWSGVKDQDAEKRYGKALYDALGPDDYARVSSGEAYGSLMRLARTVEERGFDAENLLVRTARSRELDTADDASKAMHHRLKNAYRLVERDQVNAEKAEQRAALAAQEQKVDNAIQAGQETADPEHLQQLVAAADEAAKVHPFQDELLQQTIGMQTGAEVLQAEDGAEAAQQQEAAVIEAATAEPLDQEQLQRLILTSEPEPVDALELHHAELLKQSLAYTEHTEVLHAGQANEVKQRQAAEREAQMEAMDSYAARTPDLDGDLGRFMGEWAELMDQRVERLGQRVAEEQPEWAIDRLGPVPEDPIERADWELRAGRVERYREAHNFDKEADAIGQAPPDGAVEARADWERARRALGVPEDLADISRASEESLRQSVARAEREEQWAPPYVADDMQKSFTAERDYEDQAVQMELRAQEMAQKEAAEHEERITKAMHEAQTAGGYNEHQQALAQSMALQQVPTLQAEVDPSELVKDTRERAETSRDIAGSMGERARKYQEVHETREKWFAETQQVREEADYARIELERRNPVAPETEQAEPESAPAAAAPSPQRSVEEELMMAMEQARQAQQIIEQRAQEREREQEAQREREAQNPKAEEVDRERRDAGIDFEAQYERLGQELAGHDHDVESASAPTAPEPVVAAAPAPEPPAPPAPDIDIDIEM